MPPYGVQSDGRERKPSFEPSVHRSMSRIACDGQPGIASSKRRITQIAFSLSAKIPQRILFLAPWPKSLHALQYQSGARWSSWWKVAGNRLRVLLQPRLIFQSLSSNESETLKRMQSYYLDRKLYQRRDSGSSKVCKASRVVRLFALHSTRGHRAGGWWSQDRAGGARRCVGPGASRRILDRRGRGRRTGGARPGASWWSPALLVGILTSIRNLARLLARGHRALDDDPVLGDGPARSRASSWMLPGASSTGAARGASSWWSRRVSAMRSAHWSLTLIGTPRRRCSPAPVCAMVMHHTVTLKSAG